MRRRSHPATRARGSAARCTVLGPATTCATAGRRRGHALRRRRQRRAAVRVYRAAGVHDAVGGPQFAAPGYGVDGSSPDRWNDERHEHRGRRRARPRSTSARADDGAPPRDRSRSARERRSRRRGATAAGGERAGSSGRPTSCPPTASSSGSCPGCSSTSACSSSPMDAAIPLLERAKFLAIFASNLDEFFMVRVAGLKRRIADRLAVRTAAGLEPREVLEQIARLARRAAAEHADVFLGRRSRPALRTRASPSCAWDDLDEHDREPLHDFFADHIFPVLTPLAVDPAHPFPYISGLSLNLAVMLHNPKTGNEHFARVKVPPILPRFVLVEEASTPRATAQALRAARGRHRRQPRPAVPGHGRAEHYSFRVTRNEDLEVEEDDAENLLTALEKELTRRRFGPPVRLEVEDEIDDHVLDMLARELADQRPRDLPPARAARPARAVHRRRRRPARPEVPPVRPADAARPPPTESARRSTSSRRCATRTSCSTTPTTRSRPSVAGVHRAGGRPTPTCSRSSRRSTAPRATPRSSTP